MSRYISALGQKLLNREERFDRIVIDKKIDSREAYFKALPKLVETTQRTELAVEEAWKETQEARSEPEHKKALTKFRKRENAMRANFPKFYFKLKVYEDYPRKPGPPAQRPAEDPRGL